MTIYHANGVFLFIKMVYIFKSDLGRIGVADQVNLDENML